MPHWVVWKWTYKPERGKWDKPLLQARDPRHFARVNDPTTWADYATAVAAYNAGDLDGIGFVLQGSGLGAFDLDDCCHLETRTIDPWALDLISRAGSYTEISPSGTGLRIIGLAAGSPVHRTGVKIEGFPQSALEIYRGASRYICVTGKALGKFPLANIDQTIDEELQKAIRRPPTAAARSPQMGPASAALQGVTKSGEIGRPTASETPMVVDFEEIGEAEYSKDLEDDLRRALAFLDLSDYGDWIKYGFALYRLGDSWVRGHADDLRFELWHERAAQCAKYAGRDDCRSKWDRGISDAAERRKDCATFHSIFKEAAPLGFVPSRGASYKALGRGGDTIDGLNRRFAWVRKLNRIYRFEFKDLVNYDDFHNELADEYLKDSAGEFVVEKGKFVKASYAWKSSPRKRKHDDLDYVPGEGDITEDGKINMWSGWGVAPMEGDPQPFLDLVRNLCHARGECRPKFERYLIQWLAFQIQNPGVKIPICLQIASTVEGTGKGLLGQTAAKIFGDNFFAVTTDALENRFNGWAKGRQFLFCDEIDLAGDRKLAGKMRNLISEKTAYIEDKGQPAINYESRLNVYIATNKCSALHMGEYDRRQFYLHAERSYKDRGEEYADWLYNRDGAAIIFGYLLKVDLSDFDAFGGAMSTPEKSDAIDDGSTALERFVGNLVQDENEKPLQTAEEILSRFEAEHQSNRSNTTAMGNALRDKLPPGAKRKVRNGARKQRTVYAIRNPKDWVKRGNGEWEAQIIRQDRQEAESEARAGRPFKLQLIKNQEVEAAARGAENAGPGPADPSPLGAAARR